MTADDRRGALADSAFAERPFMGDQLGSVDDFESKNDG
jgi:hypothetical protein